MRTVYGVTLYSQNLLGSCILWVWQSIIIFCAVIRNNEDWLRLHYNLNYSYLPSLKAVSPPLSCFLLCQMSFKSHISCEWYGVIKTDRIYSWRDWTETQVVQNQTFPSATPWTNIHQQHKSPSRRRARLRNQRILSDFNHATKSCEVEFYQCQSPYNKFPCW